MLWSFGNIMPSPLCLSRGVGLSFCLFTFSIAYIHMYLLLLHGLTGNVFGTHPPVRSFSPMGSDHYMT
jgi:hypothetical protein